MKVIVPCGGRSSRYPGTPPKWTLPSGSGRPMVVEAVRRLEFDPKDLIVTILKEHDEKFDARAALRSAFGGQVEVVVLEKPTANQPETVSNTLRLTGLDEPFLVKDSDNCFALTNIDRPYNYVCCESLNSFEAINPRNKSYIRTDESGIVMAIREKQVISDLFSVGGYFFVSPQKYLDTYDDLTSTRGELLGELYTSDIIARMILGGDPFSSARVSEYEDWGTLKEWRSKLQKTGAYFVLLDGFIMERGNAHFTPRFADVRANEEAVKVTRQLADDGHRLIFLSIRPDSARAETEVLVRSLGLPADDIIFNMPLGRYSVVSTSHPTVPFTTAHGLEIAPDEPRMAMRLRFEE